MRCAQEIAVGEQVDEPVVMKAAGDGFGWVRGVFQCGFFARGFGQIGTAEEAADGARERFEQAVAVEKLAAVRYGG
jgi:hypothetical protein